MNFKSKSKVINYHPSEEHQEKGEILIDVILLGGLNRESMKDFRNNHIVLVVEGRVILPKNIMKNHPKEIDFANFINDFLNNQPKEIISAVNDLKS
ncbi:hypothetical protein LCGC14_0924950 [marine sediment metagenome]|uniref:Uncharacterized protein n=1 Tax=marine sediment metagenome TaxID=412755 RepID=A0A0F9RW87_9ZZZZ